jgi:hypothetical protein
MAGIISNEFPSLMKEFPVWPVHPLIGSFAGAAEDVDLSPSPWQSSSRDWSNASLCVSSRHRKGFTGNYVLD